MISELMFRRSAAPLICALTLALSLASFRAESQDIRITGDGQATCGEWIQYRYNRNSVRQNYVADWVAGFVTGYNWYHMNHQAYLHDANDVLGWLDVYCHNNPTSSVSAGAAALVQQLGGEPALFQWKQ